MLFNADFKDTNQSIDAEFGTEQPLSADLGEVQVINIGGGQTPRIVEITLLADAWVGNASPYKQIVTIDGITNKSFVEIQVSDEQLELFRSKDLALTVCNKDGVVIVSAIGDKPKMDHTIQASIVEVEVWK